MFSLQSNAIQKGSIITFAQQRISETKDCQWSVVPSLCISTLVFTSFILFVMYKFFLEKLCFETQMSRDVIRKHRPGPAIIQDARNATSAHCASYVLSIVISYSPPERRSVWLLVNIIVAYTKSVNWVLKCLPPTKSAVVDGQTCPFCVYSTVPTCTIVFFE